MKLRFAFLISDCINSMAMIKLQHIPKTNRKEDSKMKKKIKQFICLMLAIVFVLGIQPAVYGAGTPTGTIKDGVLTISGSGEVPCVYYGNTEIHTLIIGEGITSIAMNAFENDTNLKEVYLPISLTVIKRYAFQNCSAIETVYYAGTEAQKQALISKLDSSNDYLKNATWICSDTVQPAENSLVFSNATVKCGETAAVTLSLSSGCSRVGATLTVRATGENNSTLPITGVVIDSELCGAVNRNNDGTIAISCDKELEDNAVLAAISFKCETEGVYTLSVEGEMYTGADNTPVDYSVESGTVTVEKRTVSVVWKDYDEKVLGSAEVDPDSEMKPSFSGETPTRAADTYYTYAFSCWNETSAEGSKVIEYTAVYTATARTYTVTVNSGVAGAVVTITDSEKNAVSPNNDGSFTLLATESYSCTVKAIGYKAMSFTLKMDDENSSWSIDKEKGSAVFTTAEPTLAIGDLNDDGNVDITDAQALYNYLAGNYTLEDGLAYEGSVLVFNYNVADINGNERVGADDILPMLDLINELNNG